MSLKSQALKDMAEVMTSIDADPAPCSDGQRNQKIVSGMQKRGWKLTASTLHETARYLGLTVVGTHIYKEIA